MVKAGDIYGRLTVIERIENYKTGSQGNARLWRCKCECGKFTDVISAELTRKNGRGTKSCGCLAIEVTKATNTKHGGRNEKLYVTWRDIKHRTMNPNHKSFSAYGARGIKMCDEWLNDYAKFREYVSKLPGFEFAFAEVYKDKWTLDRLDTNGNYEPGNLRWLDWSGQAANRR